MAKTFQPSSGSRLVVRPDAIMFIETQWAPSSDRTSIVMCVAPGIERTLWSGPNDLSVAAFDEIVERWNAALAGEEGE